ncbi:MAG: LacI family transcriptional regulator [Lachnospiraceae bacterium]|nr:LacI family transcriptional regulator [Lachnospiraceae bacterium]
MGKRNKVTTRDIAEELGISQSTVSMILSGRPGVSFTPETVKKVKETAAAMGYSKPMAAEKIKERALEHTIIILCPMITNGYYSMMIHSITEYARNYGYTVLTASTDRDAANEDIYLELLNQTRLAGLVSLYPLNRIQKLDALSKIVPVISVGDKPPSCRFDSVELDSKKPGCMIGEYLISLGHTRITYISTPIRSKEISRINRLEGVKNSFRNYGIPEDQLEVRYPRQSLFDQYSRENAEYQNGYDQTIRALEEGTNSTAFIGNNDMVAFGIMAALSDRGYRIPKDYSVCGFDNISLSAMPQISLTTIDHAAMQKGKEAVNMIYRKNQQKKQGSERSYVVRLEYEPQLIVRKSTGKFKE